MTKHVPPKPALWQVVVGVAGCLWMLWEITARSAGWTEGYIRYPAMLLCMFSVNTWISYRRWRNAADGLGEPLAS